MPAPPPDTRVQRARVTSLRATGADAVVLRIAFSDGALPPLRAGRFFMLRRTDRLSPAIPRPFSVYRQLESGELEFMIKVMGAGTRALAASTPGTELLVVGPLGHGFPPLETRAHPWVFVGGGIGSVPFSMLIEQTLATAGARAADLAYVYGGRDASYLYDLAHFESLGVRVLTTTDDGSAGFHGNVVQCIEAARAAGELPLDASYAACGPERMMEAVAHMAAAQGATCLLSLETMMGCGVGICNGCAVPTRPEGPLGAWSNVKCCVEGPVFDAAAIRMS